MGRIHLPRNVALHIKRKRLDRVAALCQLPKLSVLMMATTLCQAWLLPSRSSPAHGVVAQGQVDSCGMQQ